MKKYINGKKYDTEATECVGIWDNGCYGRDFQRCSERLYRKRTGEFFLHGEGGPMSKYAVSIGDNNWSGSEQIIPLSWDAAREWAESHLSGDEYEEIFGEIEEDESRVHLNLSLSASTVEKAKRDAQKRGMMLSPYIESLVNAVD